MKEGTRLASNTIQHGFRLSYQSQTKEISEVSFSGKQQTSKPHLNGVPGAEGIGQQHSLEDAHGAPLASPSLLPLLPLLLPVSSVSVASGADPSVCCCTPGVKIFVRSKSMSQSQL